jgi:hypothetical protein
LLIHNPLPNEIRRVPPWDCILVGGDSDATLDCGQDLTAQDRCREIRLPPTISHWG